MEPNSENIADRRAARDKLFAVLERRLARLTATMETKAIGGTIVISPVGAADGGLEILGAPVPASASRKLEDVVVPRRPRRRQNPSRSRMGA